MAAGRQAGRKASIAAVISEWLSRLINICHHRRPPRHHPFPSDYQNVCTPYVGRYSTRVVDSGAASNTIVQTFIPN